MGSFFVIVVLSCADDLITCRSVDEFSVYSDEHNTCRQVTRDLIFDIRTRSPATSIDCRKIIAPTKFEENNDA